MSAMISPFGLALTFVVTVGVSTADLGKGGSTEADGYATSDPTFGSFGAISPDTWSGLPILSLYNVGGTTQFVLDGDAHLASPVVKVNGANQNLGAGTFSAGKTTFSGSAANPFTGATQPVTIT